MKYDKELMKRYIKMNESLFHLSTMNILKQITFDCPKSNCFTKYWIEPNKIKADSDRDEKKAKELCFVDVEPEIMEKLVTYCE
jgi:hypothetical protein